MTIDIDQLTADELVALNHRIVERLRFLDTLQAHRDMMAFNIGNRVSFDSRQGRQFGILTKYNKKTVTVVTDNGERWNISPHLLSEVKEAGLVKNVIDNYKK
ncbi:MAG TPA: hypothetical protein ENI67_05015 [Gammaproteobacteria bacterium]|mgnify:CR=1 FL=1|nr:hypothetical protein [Gammaproteobacteria bacterium]